MQHCSRVYLPLLMTLPFCTISPAFAEEGRARRNKVYGEWRIRPQQRGAPASPVNFWGDTLSTKQRVWSAWSNGGTLRNTSSTFGCSLSKCQQQQKTRQKAPADRLTSGTLAQPEPTGLFRRRTIRSPNRIRTFNPRVNSLLLTSGAGFSQRADRAPEPNRFEPPTRQ